MTERGGASGTGYFNPFNNRWELALADLAAPGIEWSSKLPEIVTSDARAGVVREGMGAVVGAGTGDNMTAALGLDVREGDTVISLGTSGTLYGRTSDEQYVLRSSGLEVWLFISRRRKSPCHWPKRFEPLALWRISRFCLRPNRLTSSAGVTHSMVYFC